MSTLEVHDVSAGYGPVLVLDGVSCGVAPDAVVALLGSNGSGKSTLIKTILGLTTLYRGSIRWDGQAIEHLPTHTRAQRGLGYVPQTDNVFADLTISENLRIGGYLQKKRVFKQQLEIVDALFPFLLKRSQTLGGSLSGGERRMLAIASCLMMSPRCLLLDEPTADLAPAAIDTIFAKIHEIRRTLGLPILLVEQNVRRALSIADYVYVLARGRNRLERAAHDIDERELGAVFLESGRLRAEA
jgi:branched-chain amino acid transport system ATP-binding protein